MECTPGSFSQIQPMFPIYLLYRTAGAAVFNLLGWPEGINFVNLNAIDNKDEIVLGADTWKCFPIHHRTANLNADHPTGRIPGFALKIG